MSSDENDSALDLAAERSETRAIDDGTVLETFLEDKFKRDPEEEDRWTQTEGEYHSGQVANCPRQWYWDWQGEPTDPGPDAYPYFELGHAHEERYGEALESIYGAERIRQDVEVEIHLHDEIVLVGESDWCLLREDLPPDLGLWYVVESDGTRYEYIHQPYDGDNPSLKDLDIVAMRPVEDDEPPMVETVIETKTTKEVSKKRQYGHSPQHERQLMTYLHGTGATDGKIVYIERDNLEEHVVDIPYDESTWLDNKYRTIQHHANLQSDDVPDIDPIDRTQCWYCDHKDRCNDLDGGSEWS